MEEKKEYCNALEVVRFTDTLYIFTIRLGSAWCTLPSMAHHSLRPFLVLFYFFPMDNPSLSLSTCADFLFHYLADLEEKYPVILAFWYCTLTFLFLSYKYKIKCYGETRLSFSLRTTASSVFRYFFSDSFFLLRKTPCYSWDPEEFVTP